MADFCEPVRSYLTTSQREELKNFADENGYNESQAIRAIIVQGLRRNQSTYKQAV